MPKACGKCIYSIGCPNNIYEAGVELKINQAKYKTANPQHSRCGIKCPGNWYCSRPEGHDGPHEAHKNHNANDGALALWGEVNDNLKRLI